MLWDFEKQTIYSSDVILRFTEAFNYDNKMSGRSMTSNSLIVTTGVGGSVRQHTSSGGLSNGIKFAGEDSKDKMYEPKHSKKLIRVLTVVAYIFSVSLAAIMLSVYYVFLWNPKDIPHRAVRHTTPIPTPSCPHPLNASFVKQGKPTEGAIAVPQLQEPETTVSIDGNELTRSTPVPLLLSRLLQTYPRAIPSTVSNHQTHTNYTMNQLNDT